MFIKKRCLHISILGLLSIGQFSFAATYIPAEKTNAGKIQFNNIQTEKHGNISTSFLASDKGYLKIGQFFILDTKKIAASSGKQDGTYHFKSKTLVAKKIFESPNILHDLSLRHVGIDKTKPHLNRYKIMEIHSKFTNLKKQLQAQEKSPLLEKNAKSALPKPKTPQKSRNELNNPQAKERQHKNQNAH